MHYAGDARYLNCWVLVIYLLVTGRVKGIRLRGFPHIVGVTWNNNLIHFKGKKGIGLWFLGKVEVYNENSGLLRHRIPLQGTDESLPETTRLQ